LFVPYYPINLRIRTKEGGVHSNATELREIQEVTNWFREVNLAEKLVLKFAKWIVRELRGVAG